MSRRCKAIWQFILQNSLMKLDVYCVRYNVKRAPCKRVPNLLGTRNPVLNYSSWHGFLGLTGSLPWLRIAAFLFLFVFLSVWKDSSALVHYDVISVGHRYHFPVSIYVDVWCSLMIPVGFCIIGIMNFLTSIIDQSHCMSVCQYSFLYICFWSNKIIQSWSCNRTTFHI